MTREAGGRRRRGRAPGCEALEDRRLMAVSLAFDYSLDSSGFFTAGRRALLESTLNAITARLGDTLAAVPTASYTLATDQGNRTVVTSSPADVVKVYVYGQSLNDGSIAQGGAYYSTGPGGTMRGQGANDYAPDLAYLKFDVDGSTSWFFGSTTAGLTGSQVDFVTVARHEFLHSLGFLSSQPTFVRNVQGSSFVGASAVAANGGAAVPMSGSHVAASVPSIMNAVTQAGERRDLGDLEWAMLKDLGWSVAAPAAAFERGFELFTGGEGDGTARVKVIPSRGVYLMPLDVLGGDTLRLRTLDGSSVLERGVDSYLKVFDASGALVFSNNDTSTTAGKEDVTYTFPAGGRYWVGAGTYAQRDFTFTTPSPAAAGSTAYYLEATLTGRSPDEPGDIASATQAVAFSGGAFGTTTTLAGPSADVYRIDAIAGATYIATTSPPGEGGLSGPAVAAVYDASGRKVAGPTASPYGSLTWVATATAPYYVRISRVVAADVISTVESAPDPGFSSSSPNGEATISGGRSVGSDYALAITRRIPAPPPSVEPLYVDYGAYGLWRWTEAGGWSQINAADPQDLAVAADGSLFIDYGPYGLWRWSESAGIRQVNAADAQAMTPGADGSLFLDYGPYGLWRWTAAAGLARINESDPQGFAAGPSGELYVDYGPYGLWSWTASSGLRRINASDPEGMAAGPGGTLFVDYGPYGLWTWTTAGGWSRIHAADPQGLAAGPGGDLYIDFGASGLWAWSAAGGFRLLNPADPQGLAVAADGWLFVDYGPYGAWRWADFAGFRQINPGDPQKLAARPALAGS